MTVGDATVEIAPDGTRTVTRADDTILVSPELGPNALFERIHDTEAPA